MGAYNGKRKGKQECVPVLQASPEFCRTKKREGGLFSAKGKNVSMLLRRFNSRTGGGGRIKNCMLKANNL